MTENKNKIVTVAMSGGVDSSVAAVLLIEEGYSVIGITMKTYDFMEVGGNVNNLSNCCDPSAVLDAHSVATQLGFPHHVVNLRDKFNSVVIENFVDEYKKGRTPNPCVLCNREIKWGALLEKAESLGANYIATGHYARVRCNQTNGRYILSRGHFAEKDQSYALWNVPQSALAKTIFPLGEKTKPEVRALAEKYGLRNAHKNESFEICFIPDDDYERFLKDREPETIKSSGGDILWNGKVVGKHEGYQFYTIGQRRNIGAYGQKMYVTEIDSRNNTISIGTDSELFHHALIADQVNLIGVSELKDGMKVEGKVRYKDDATSATVYNEDGGKIRIVFDKPKRAITPGQSVVLYDGDDLVCGGIIEKAFD